MQATISFTNTENDEQSRLQRILLAFSIALFALVRAIERAFRAIEQRGRRYILSKFGLK
jgi:hypothetical protein